MVKIFDGSNEGYTEVVGPTVGMRVGFELTVGFRVGMNDGYIDIVGIVVG